MRWSIIRLIWFRELRDQLRDRRTLFMIAVLPLLIYPILGFAVLQFAMGFQEKASTIGIVRGPLGTSDFPERPLQADPPSDPLYPPLVKGKQFTVADARLLKTLTREQAELFSRGKLKIEFLAGDDLTPLEERKVDLILSASPDFYAALERDERLEEGGARPKIYIEARPDDDYSRLATARLYPLLDAWERRLRDVRLERKGLTHSFDQ